jgi:hypothetical protein
MGLKNPKNELGLLFADGGISWTTYFTSCTLKSSRKEKWLINTLVTQTRNVGVLSDGC